MNSTLPQDGSQDASAPPPTTTSTTGGGAPAPAAAPVPFPSAQAAASSALQNASEEIFNLPPQPSIQAFGDGSQRQAATSATGQGTGSGEQGAGGQTAWIITHMLSITCRVEETRTTTVTRRVPEAVMHPIQRSPDPWVVAGKHEHWRIRKACSARGVSETELIKDVESWLAKKKFSIEEAEVVIRKKYEKYENVASSVHSQKARLAEKVLEFNNSLSIIDTLIEKRAAQESFETTFMLSDDVYSKAVVEKPETVWIGKAVKTEYPLEDAKKLLKKDRDSAQKVVDELTNELAFIKDQVTTTEVNLSHIVNYGVNKRREAAAK